MFGKALLSVYMYNNWATMTSIELDAPRLGCENFYYFIRSQCMPLVSSVVNVRNDLVTRKKTL